ncbi:MAG: PmoA family protein [Verrucomicrobiae bacterium]|nr:PmoA family protein [Verrucomicrobiae bacterium]
MFPAISRRRWRRWLGLVVLTGWVTSGLARGATGLEVVRHDDRFSVRFDGELLTEWRVKGAPKPYFYPLLGPGGVPVTRHFPMRTDVEDEDRDHPHQRSLWFTHGDVNGVDFWAEGPTRGRIVFQDLLDLTTGAEGGQIRTSNKWMTAEGKVLLSDVTRFRVERSPLGRQFEISITLHASEGEEVTFGDTKEGTMGIRLAESMRLKPNRHYAGKPHGRILQSTGVKDGATWGKRAAWTAYSGPVGGTTITVSIFDHPSNPRHPTWWHVRDYGLFAANPFGVHDFERKPAGTGNLVLKAGEKATFRYRFLVQDGEPDPRRLNEVATQFAASPH